MTDPHIPPAVEDELQRAGLGDDSPNGRDLIDSELCQLVLDVDDGELAVLIQAGLVLPIRTAAGLRFSGLAISRLLGSKEFDGRMRDLRECERSY